MILDHAFDGRIFITMADPLAIQLGKTAFFLHLLEHGAEAHAEHRILGGERHGTVGMHHRIARHYVIHLQFFQEKGSHLDRADGILILAFLQRGEDILIEVQIGNLIVQAQTRQLMPRGDPPPVEIRHVGNFPAPIDHILLLGNGERRYHTVVVHDEVRVYVHDDVGIPCQKGAVRCRPVHELQLQIHLQAVGKLVHQLHIPPHVAAVFAQIGIGSIVLVRYHMQGLLKAIFRLHLHLRR